MSGSRPADEAAVATYANPAFHEGRVSSRNISLIEVVRHEEDGSRGRIEVRCKCTGSVSSALRIRGWTWLGALRVVLFGHWYDAGTNDSKRVSAEVAGVANDLSYLLCVPPRSQHIPLEGAHNFRDLGGYPAGDRQVRWGRLYRSDALHHLTPDDVATLRRLGLRWIVDLRPPGEAAGTGRGRMAAEPVGYLNLSASRDDERRPDPPVEGDELVGRYLTYLHEGGAAFAAALHHMADADHYPMVFHCFFGKDRSGVLAALVLGCLGVDRQAIVDDYALSGIAMESILASLATDPVYRDTIERTPPSRLAASATTMDRFLQQMEARYGGVAGWALRAGVPEGEIEILRRLLLE